MAVAAPPLQPEPTIPSAPVETISIPAQPIPLRIPPLFAPSVSPSQLITQGAEALVYKTTYLSPSQPASLKYRPSKSYRHPLLDARLTKHRVLSEARLLARCRRDGVDVPALYAVDGEAGWMLSEWIGGGTVRAFVEEALKRQRDGTNESELKLELLMQRIGESVGRLHASGVVHGDLTSSNLMLRAGPSSLPSGAATVSSETAEQDIEVVLIDFGLGAVSVQDEDRAVDLYVLERAFISTHPRAESLFPAILKAYGTSFGGARIVLKRLEDVRMRGRKRSMVG
jgi:TP53 regulating kinase-like protein